MENVELVCTVCLVNASAQCERMGWAQPGSVVFL